MKIALYANTEWYLYNFRLPLAEALRREGHQILLLSPDGEYGKRLQDLGFDWRQLPMDRRSLNPFSELYLIGHICRLCVREKVDIVHGFTTKPAVYSVLAARLSGLHGGIGAVTGLGYVFTSDEPFARVLRPLVRFLLARVFGGSSTRLILQNSEDLDFFISQVSVPSENTRLIRGSGVDIGRFFPRDPASGRPRETVRILYAGRLLRDKGIQDYVEAARLMQGADSKLQFQVAGLPDEGNPSSVSGRQLEEWQREGTVEWLGHVEDMPGLYPSVDIFVLPSYREGLPKSLIEAAACGVALVASDVPGCRDVIDDGINGLLFSPGHPEAIARAIERLLLDAGLRRRMGLAARDKAVREFSSDRINEETCTVYRELMNLP